MHERIKQAWGWAGHISTVVTWWQIGVALIGGGAMGSWLHSQLGTPLGVTLGIFVFAAIVNVTVLLTDRRKGELRQFADRLSEFRTVGVALRNKPIADDAELADWVILVDEWRHNLDSTITKHFGKAKAESITVLDQYDPPEGLPPHFNEFHKAKRDDLSERLTRLKGLIDKINEESH
jgi:hypothetical protein